MMQVMGRIIEHGEMFEGLPPRAAEHPVIVVHESVTRSAAATRRVLRKRGLSCHFGIAEDARIIQWAGIDRRCAHAGPLLNPRSIGIELTNPYYPRLVRAATSHWSDVIVARWAHEGVYVVPSLRQLEALWKLACALHEAARVPLAFIGAESSPVAEGAVRLPMRRHRVARDAEGIVAHSAVGHADGAFPVAYMLARSLGHDAEDARGLVMRLARTAHSHIDIEPASRP